MALYMSVGGYQSFGGRRALNVTLSTRNLPQRGEQVGSLNVNMEQQVWRTDTRMFSYLDNRRNIKFVLFFSEAFFEKKKQVLFRKIHVYRSTTEMRAEMEAGLYIKCPPSLPD
jgi:hypothetical protein